MNYLPALQHVVHPETSTATAFHSSSLSSVIVVVIVIKYRKDDNDNVIAIRHYSRLNKLI